MNKLDMEAIQKAEQARDRRKRAIQSGASRVTVARLFVIEATACAEAAGVLGKAR